jgi:serine protease AprX
MTAARVPRIGRRRVGTAVVAACVVASGVASVAPASASQSGSGTACQGTAIDAGTLTLTQLNQAMGVNILHGFGLTGAGIDVAVIDTGVNAVPGLAGAGKVSDAVDLSFDAPQPGIRYRDLFGHGTAMAGIIAGDGTGGPLTRGVAPGARIVNVKVGAGDGSVDTSQVIAALDWVVQHRTAAGRNIRVVNLSYTTDAAVDYRSDPLSQAVDNAWKAGIVVVVSGGNDGRGIRRLGNPALNPNVIAVGGAELDAASGAFRAATWSSTGDGVRNPDLVAPGSMIAGLRVPGSALDTSYPGARVYDPATCTVLFRGSGTSQAAAVVSGITALMLQAKPGLTPAQIKQLLRITASPRNPVEQNGAGLVNLVGAFNSGDSGSASPLASGTTGTLEASRGSMRIGTSPDVLAGEYTAFLSGFSAASWSRSSRQGKAWSQVSLDGDGRMTKGTWSGSSWSGSSWSGSSWSGSSWSGSSWSGSSWSGSSWSGSSWSGSSWSGSSWSGVGWR